MRQARICAFLVIAASWATVTVAKGPTLEPIPAEGSAVAVEGDVASCPDEGAPCPGCGRHGCHDCGNPCGGCAAAGCFNCACRGSYKFPVPPLYTYHWPGMYSQKSMIEPWKPYRFPPLNAPSWDEPASASASVHGPSLKQTSSETIVKSSRSATSEPLSARFLRLSE